MRRSQLRKFIPRSVLESYRRCRRHRTDRDNLSRSTEEVFTDIYRSAGWGGSRGEFCSGAGSTDAQVIASYVQAVHEEVRTHGCLGLSFVDLGCGDFRVGRQLLPLCSKYIGVDIVRDLVDRNQQLYGDVRTLFFYADIVKDELPDGDVCFVRQVFQHLSNEQIILVLPKLKKYRLVFITEHHPSENSAGIPNIDKVQGAGIRLSENSGVYVAEEPFGLPGELLSVVLEVPGGGQLPGTDQGVIRTVLYRPRGDQRDLAPLSTSGNGCAP